MHIFIDESGTFTVPKDGSAPALSCVGAVVLPSAEIDAIQAAFSDLVRPWTDAGEEVKGRLLGERQMDAFLAFLAECRGLIEVVAIDLAFHRVAQVREHQEGQARRLSANLTDAHHPNVWQAVRDLAARIRALAIPNYVQLVSYGVLVDAILRNKTMYIVQRRPLDLGVFDWTLDAKGQPITEMEKLWSLLIKPFLQSSSLNEPLPHLDWCDYSAFDAAFLTGTSGLPAHLEPFATPSARRRERPIDLNRLLARMRFAPSHTTPGLQIADLAVSAVRRALLGNLGREGWRRLGSVMVQRERGEEVVNMLALAPDIRRIRGASYLAPLREIRAAALPMVAS